MKTGDRITLDESKLNPLMVKMADNYISIYNREDDVQLDETEARKLLEILKEHFNEQ